MIELKKTIMLIIIITLSMPIIIISSVIMIFEYQIYEKKEAAKKMLLEKNPQITEVIKFRRASNFMEGEEYNADVLINGEICWIESDDIGYIDYNDCEEN